MFMYRKKARVIALLMVCICLIAGCGAKTPSDAQSGANTPLSLREAVLGVASDAAGLTALTKDDLSDVLGIEPETYTDFIYLQGEGLDGREILVLRAVDTESAVQVKSRVEAYLDQRRKETQNYLPEAYRLLTKASVENKGLTVALFVGPDAAKESAALLAGE